MNRYVIKEASEINEAINSLPVAVEHILEVGDGEGHREVNGFKGIEVTYNNSRKFVSLPTRQYHLVQHEQAFRPIIEGLTQAGVQDYNFLTWANHKRAELQVFVGNTGLDTVRLGFKCANSFDRTSTISYGISMDRSSSYIEVVGYRLACSNGMIVRVPLDKAEFVKPELRVKLKEMLWEQKAKIRHNRLADNRIAAIQYAVEAVSLLREPVEAMIKGAINKVLTEEQISSLVEQHISKRYRERILSEVNGSSLWDLYNAVTSIASHDETLKDRRRIRLMKSAANILLEVL